MDKSEKYKLYQEWIERIEVMGEGLTEWEDNFVGSVKIQLEEKGSLSPKQVEILERIYAEKAK